MLLYLVCNTVVAVTFCNTVVVTSSNVVVAVSVPLHHDSLYIFNAEVARLLKTYHTPASLNKCHLGSILNFRKLYYY